MVKQIWANPLAINCTRLLVLLLCPSEKPCMFKIAIKLEGFLAIINMCWDAINGDRKRSHVGAAAIRYRIFVPAAHRIQI